MGVSDEIVSAIYATVKEVWKQNQALMSENEELKKRIENLENDVITLKNERKY